MTKQGSLDAVTDQEVSLATAVTKLAAQVGLEEGIRHEFLAQQVERGREIIEGRVRQASTSSPESEPALANLQSRIGTLREFAGDRFMEPEAVFEALESIGLTVPDEERDRLKAELALELSHLFDFAGFVNRLIKLKEESEERSTPLIAKLPRVVVPQDGGEVRGFTITEMHRAIRESGDPAVKGLRLPRTMMDSTKQQVPASTLRAWTSTCLMGSKGHLFRGEKGQVALQRRLLGEGAEIDESMILVMLIRALQGEVIMDERTQGKMRLNAEDRDGDPISVTALKRDFSVDADGTARFRTLGIGASVEIQSILG